MTRFVHDQFAKDLLEKLLTPLGEVKPSHTLHPETREVDVWFVPHPNANISTVTNDPSAALGLLARFATQPASFEPFRNPVSETDICDCLLKLLELRGDSLGKPDGTTLLLTNPLCLGCGFSLPRQAIAC